MQLFLFENTKFLKNKAIIVTGGCGYIGSHFLDLISNKRNTIICIDNLSGDTHYKIKKKLNKIIYYKKSITDEKSIKKIFDNFKIDDVYHFAALKNAIESNKLPSKYFQNNLYDSIKFLNLLKKYQIKNFIFSSSAAVYGSQKFKKSYKESDRLKPISVYGKTKSLFEDHLEKKSKELNFNIGILRYFNVVGKKNNFNFKKSFKKSNSLFDNCAKSIIYKKSVNIFGKDFNTKDGTAVRDYIHVSDLVKIHQLSMKYIKKNNKNLILNCGYGKGFSVLNVVNTFEYLYNCKISKNIVKRNYMDPEKSIANVNKLTKLLKFRPTYDDLNKIIKSHVELFQ